MQNADKATKLILLLIIAAVLFNFPIMALAAKARLVLGLPQLYFYIFLVWAGIIIATAWLVHRPGQSRLPGEKES
jgi:hypothetical protein